MVVRTAVVMVALGLALSACGIRFVEHEFEDDHTVADKVASVRMQTGSGNVTIRAVEGTAETRIHRRVQHPRDKKPDKVSHAVEGNVLVLRDCGNNCTIDYDITVPDKAIKVTGDLGSGDVVVEGLASVEVTAGSGRVEARDITGNVRLDAGSGDFTAQRIGGDVQANVSSGRVEVSDVKGKTNLQNGSGDIIGERLDADVIAEASSGRVTLKLASKHAVRATAQSGDIEVHVPGGPYRVNADTGSGDRRIDIPTDPAASPELVLRSGSGDITVSPA